MTSPEAPEPLLLWGVHYVLRSYGWTCVDNAGEDTTTTAEAASDALQWANLRQRAASELAMLPPIAYLVPATSTQATPLRVCVRAILVQSKLFVHFVADALSVRLDLCVKDFLSRRKTPTSSSEVVQEVYSGHRLVAIVAGTWLLRLETLEWRMNRVLQRALGQTAPEAVRAELTGLPDRLVLLVGSFLSAVDLCHAGQTCHELEELNHAHDLWETRLRSDYHNLHNHYGIRGAINGNPKDEYKRELLAQRDLAERKRMLWQMMMEDTEGPYLYGLPVLPGLPDNPLGFNPMPPMWHPDGTGGPQYQSRPPRFGDDPRRGPFSLNR